MHNLVVLNVLKHKNALPELVGNSYKLSRI